MAGLAISTPEAFEGRRPLWAYLWPAGMVLADLVATELAPRLRGRAVVELGCGLGALGIAAARAGGRVTLTDEEPEALALAQANATANGVAVRLHRLEWSRVPDALAGAFDVVLGSDITYSPDQIAPLLGALDTLLAPGGEAFIADADRLNETILRAGGERAGLAALRLRTVTHPPPLQTSDHSEDRPVHVYRLWRNLSGGSRV